MRKSEWAITQFQAALLKGMVAVLELILIVTQSQNIRERTEDMINLSKLRSIKN